MITLPDKITITEIWVPVEKSDPRAMLFEINSGKYYAWMMDVFEQKQIVQALNKEK